jgi:membrane protease YdiL (CAAX protease family)
MDRRRTRDLLWLLVMGGMAALAIPATPPVYHLLVDWGWIDPAAVSGGDPFGKVLRRLLLIPGAVLGLWILRPWEDIGLDDMGLRGPRSRPRAALLGFGTTLVVVLVVLAVHVAAGWLVVEVTDGTRKVAWRVVKTLGEGLFVATLENVFFRAWFPVFAARWVPARLADAVAVLVFASLHAFRASNLDEPVTHDTAGAWEAVTSWVGTLADPVAFGPAWVGLVLFGTLLTVAYRRSKTLWLTIGIHAAGIWALQSYGAFTTRLDSPWWAGTKALYDGAPGWAVLLLATWWLWRRPPVPAAGRA